MELRFDCIKLFHEKSHAEDFVAGNLRMTRITFYKDVKCIRGVQDPNEGCLRLNEKLEIYINVSKLETEQLTKSTPKPKWVKLADNIDSLSYGGFRNTFILCATDIGSSLCLENRSCDPNEQIFSFSEEYLDFGKEYKHAVLFNSKEIEINLRKYAQDNNWLFHSGLVRYDDSLYYMNDLTDDNGLVDASKFVFTKQTLFDYEHEYRFALLPIPEGDNNTLVEGDAFIASVGALQSAYDFDIELLPAHGFCVPSK